jgi:PAS domain S-box-containing protein
MRGKSNKKVKLWKQILKYSIYITVLLTVLLGYFWIDSVHTRYQNDLQNYREDYLETQKDRIQYEVENAIRYINFKKSQTEERLKEEIKTRVNEAHSIAQNIYKKNKESKTEKEIQQLIINALRPIRFNNKRGYYFIVNMQGVEKMYPVAPELENKNLLELQDHKGNYVIKDELRVVEEFGEGFVRDYWPKPGGRDEMIYPKITFVKKFEPLDWYIGTGEYLDNVKQDIQKEVLQQLSSIRFGEQGYIFVNSYKGIPLIRDGIILKNAKSSWELTDPNGVKVLQEQREAVKSPEGDFIEYSWRKLDGQEPVPKISFIMGVPDWKWMVGAGVYLDDLETVISNRKEEIKEDVFKAVSKIVVILITVLILVYLYTHYMSGKIKNNFKILSNFFNSVVDLPRYLQLNELKYEEFVELGNTVNKMLEKRIKAEKELEEERELFITGPVITFKWNVKEDWRLEYVSPNIAQFGYTQDEFVSGKTHFSHIIHPADRDRTMAEVDEFIKSDKKLLEQDFRIFTQNDKVAWVYDRMKLKRDENGNVTSYYGYLVDITERKVTEIQVENEKAYMENLFENSPDCIVLVDKNSNVIKCNKNFKTLFGYGSQEAKGKNLDYLITKEDQIEEASQLTTKAEGGERVFTETVRYTKTGKPVHVSILGVPIIFSDRELEVYAIYRDITKRKVAEEKLRQTNAELKQLKQHLEDKVKQAVHDIREKDQMLMVQSRQAAMGEMIGNIAHQWRQPLNGLGLLIQDFEEAYEFGEMNEEYLEKQTEKGMQMIQYLSDTIDDFRNFFKPSKHKQEFSVAQTVKKTITLVESSFMHNNIKLDFQVEEDAMILGQRNQFSQVVINILNNAKDAFKDNEVCNCLVELNLSKTGEKAKLIIKDNAGGIPADIIDKIFDSYFTTKEDDKGTGLGLFMSKTIIEKNMNGQIYVKNVDEGAEFTIIV